MTKRTPLTPAGQPFATWVGPLASDDGPALQEALLADRSYFTEQLLIEPSAEALSMYYSVPEGFSLDAKELLGIWTADNWLIGVIDLIHGFPSPNTILLGFLFVVPELRRRGLARAAVRHVVETSHTAETSHPVETGGKPHKEEIVASVPDFASYCLPALTAMGFQETERFEEQVFGLRRSAGTRLAYKGG